MNIKNKFFISQSPRMLRFRDKRAANVWINILVLLVVGTCLAALFSFITTSGKIESEVSNSVVLEQVNLKRNLAGFYVNEVGESALVKTYKEFVDAQDYMHAPIETPIGSGYWSFSELHKNLNENFADRFKENFKQEFSKYEFNEEYLLQLKNSVMAGTFESSVNGNFFNLKIKNLEIKDSFEKVSVNYNFDLDIELDFKKMGLVSFEDVYSVKENCKSKTGLEELRTCYGNSLNNFDVQVFESVEKNGDKLVSLKSKRSFLIDSEFKRIEFEFVPK